MVGVNARRPSFIRVRGSLAHVCSLPVYTARSAAFSVVGDVISVGIVGGGGSRERRRVRAVAFYVETIYSMGPRDTFLVRFDCH